MQTILELEKKITKSDESVIVYLLNIDYGRTMICGLSCLDWVKRALILVNHKTGQRMKARKQERVKQWWPLEVDSELFPGLFRTVSRKIIIPE